MASFWLVPVYCFGQLMAHLPGKYLVCTVAGNGENGFYGDNARAAKARLYFPSGVAVDGAGNLMIADAANNRVREVAG
jgi:NHL repeat